ncbi:DUF2069 domain-containing protein [Aliamphritea ceti]|uniref:DUF2069 domain-containing protein n=1 Tax=Aliamphritea ceti TaxID=1524258 RepID=UPI0021C3B6CD|nr:DUF2069 domain-containing protein [Aliamphritea ceti]
MQATLQRLVNISRAATLLSYFGLILFLTAWYLIISPPPTANPYIIWAFQVIPLALFYPVIMKRNLRGHIWLCFFVSIYFMHAVQIAMSSGPNSLLGLIETLLVASLFTAAMMFTRWQSKLKKLLAAQKTQ